MELLPSILLTGIVILGAFGIALAIGFGSMLLSLPLVGLILGVKTAAPLLAILGTTSSCTIALLHRRKIEWRALRRLLGWAAPGFLLGILAYRFIPESGLKLFVGFFALAVAVHGLAQVRRPPTEPRRRSSAPSWMNRASALAAGVVHSAIASAGPLVVFFVRQQVPDNSRFRATLCAAWVLLNSVFLAGSLTSVHRDPDLLIRVAAALPFLGAAILLGEWLHDRIAGRHFNVVVHGILALSGLLLVSTAAR